MICAVFTGKSPLERYRFEGDVAGFVTVVGEEAGRMCCCDGKLKWKCGVLVVYNAGLVTNVSEQGCCMGCLDGLKGGAHCRLRLNQDRRSRSLGHLQHGPHRNDRARIG